MMAEALALADRLPFIGFLNLRQREDIVVGDDHEQGRIDGVHTLTQDRPLTTALSAGQFLRQTLYELRGAIVRIVFVQQTVRHGRRQTRFEKRDGILQIVAMHDTTECLARRKRLAVAGVDVTDLALRDRH